MLSQYTANAIYPNIYLPDYVYKNLLGKHPKPEYYAIFLHEQEHIHRQRKIGPLKFGIWYLLFPKFRFREELEAMKPQMRYLKSIGKQFDTDLRARYLSGWLYLWSVPYQYAKHKLDAAWKNS